MIHPTLEQLVRLQFEAREFSLLPRQPVHSLLSGRHASRLRGRGLMFEELRDYRPGDDIRTMDWKATARLRKPHVRVYTEERERPVLLVVDQRVNMFFGSARTTKATTAAELAALSAWRTLDVGDRVGAILFDDEQILKIRPHRSRQNVLRICHELVRMNGRLSAERRSDPSMLNEALRRACNVAVHDHLVVLITDYDGDDSTTHRLATRLAAHNDVLAALVYDPLGADLKSDASLQVTDGSRQLVLEPDEEFSCRFRTQFQRRCDQLRERLSAIRIPILPICTHDGVIDQVLAALGRRR
ncbi:DUF58 domain-containing protein [Stieleria mannarensis]|uniref:DUF58 domain-containing protein n=1 Tax=Stieleria mannarensis TaxID=2755585 RepID=UPI0016041076|nr:DUF58 domain-containing protein [Rhodopirellula sp. JC639]